MDPEDPPFNGGDPALPRRRRRIEPTPPPPAPAAPAYVYEPAMAAPPVATLEREPQSIGDYLVASGALSREDLARALELQQRSRERLGRILISQGMVSRYDLYESLAKLWGLPFADLLKTPPNPDLVRRFSPEVMIRERFMPIEETVEGVIIAAARQPEPELEAVIREVLGPVPLLFQVTSEWDIDHVMRRVFRQELLDQATNGLFYRNPRESAYTVLTRPQFVVIALGLLAMVAGLFFYPREVLIGINLAINFAFTAGVAFKFAIALAHAGYEDWEPVTQEEIEALADEDLPTFTILVPVYREASIISLLMQNLATLDYPMEKLEILVLLEEDDLETLEAAKASRPPGNVYLVVVPDQVPKTKPKACNVGLFFARGEYLVIYDAEDRPEPDQLKKAVVAFRKGADNLACVQSALSYFNARENFLTRMFTLEYSYWFDYMLPGLDRLNLPIPLGGTSNIFRTDMLRDLGGWDPYNVTEDADLGVRASARGYTIGVINSTTYEEANTRTGNWIRQRSRWVKGYMQTSLVHLRNPVRLVQAVGIRKSVGFLLLVAGTPTTFLAGPILWTLYLAWIFTRTHTFDFLFPPFTLYLSLFNLLVGNAVGVYLSMLSVFKRRQYDLIVWSLLNPVYWVLHSIAAYKALWQLFTRPFYWEKTTHGISNSMHVPSPAMHEEPVRRSVEGTL